METTIGYEWGEYFRISNNGESIIFISVNGDTDCFAFNRVIAPNHQIKHHRLEVDQMQSLSAYIRKLYIITKVISKFRHII